MNILCIGDIFAKTGRQLLAAVLPTLIEQYRADFVIVNAENAAGGRGVTRKVAEELLPLPVDVFTSGNHIWQHTDEIAPYLATGKFLRPHNAPAGRPGRGVGVYSARNDIKVGVVNLQGRVFMHEEKETRSPFVVGRAVVEELRKQTPIIIVDLHAEITAEKQAVARYLDGEVSCVYGTHTHVQTADERILPGGTAAITDIGMTGPYDSVIGMRVEDALRRFLSDGQDKKWQAAVGPAVLHGICVTVDPQTGRATQIERIRKETEERAISAH
ncbi:MAG: TIGR00282 family metallophosphoesterase [Deltaproteobacteria bacterium]|nr:TIGR00282 family metallophosphoesterase [Deltaproteobacteria bacterium]